MSVCECGVDRCLEGWLPPNETPFEPTFLIVVMISMMFFLTLRFLSNINLLISLIIHSFIYLFIDLVI